jgi:hypothetical protein
MSILLPESPSFGQLLGRGIGQGFSKGFGVAFDQKAEREKMLFEHKLKTAAAAMTPEEREFYKENYGVDISKFSPETQKAFIQQGAKEFAKKQTEGTAGLGESLDWLDDNLKYTGTKTVPGFSSFTAGGLRRDVVEKREEFDRLGFLAADQVFTHFNKGVINKDKLKLIQNDLAPNSNNSERVNKARIAALRRIAKLPKNAPAEAVNKAIDKEVAAQKKIEGVGTKALKKIEGRGGKIVTMRAPNGETVDMDEGNVEEALKRGWKKL